MIYEGWVSREGEPRSSTVVVHNVVHSVDPADLLRGYEAATCESLLRQHDEFFSWTFGSKLATKVPRKCAGFFTIPTPSRNNNIFPYRVTFAQMDMHIFCRRLLTSRAFPNSISHSLNRSSISVLYVFDNENLLHSSFSNLLQTILWINVMYLTKRWLKLGIPLPETNIYCLESRYLFASFWRASRI